MSVKSNDVRALRRRLSPDPDRPVSQQRFGELLGVTWGTVARWERDGCRGDRSARKLIRLRSVLDALGEMVKREHRLAFFTQRHPLLLNLRPIDVLDGEGGTMAVIRIIEGEG